MDGTHRTSRFCVVSFLSVFFFFPYDDDDDNKELNPVGEEASFLSPQFLTGSLIFTGVSLSLSLSLSFYIGEEKSWKSTIRRRILFLFEEEPVCFVSSVSFFLFQGKNGLDGSCVSNEKKKLWKPKTRNETTVTWLLFFLPNFVRRRRN